MLIMLLFGIFAIPSFFKSRYTLFLQVIICLITSYWAVTVLFYGETLVKDLTFPFWIGTTQIVIDRLTAFFVLVINFTSLTGILYSGDYLKPYYKESNRTKLSLSIHYFSFIWLYVSMLLVTMIRDGLDFLIFWELMSLSSFLLILFEAEKKDILKAGIIYLVQMHVALLFLLTAFIIVNKGTGVMSFDTLGIYFERYSNLGLFLIFFVGFGIKAGFIPLHTWLPQAHPAAPSHVSGVMSGVMIKLGIYGILRVLSFIKYDFIEIGVIIIILSVISGVLGIMTAVVQRDLKKLLAYSSIENIGIIGIGIGLGTIGLGLQNPLLIILGFCGGLLHILNHSLFKSLLFYCAGSVYKACHTRNIEELGGLIKKMPKTSFFFLLGSLAICGLPPLNGFISEYIIYVGFFKGLPQTSFYLTIVLIFGIIGLALIGGLAIMCFTKVFGVVFLGVARTEKAENAKEVSNGMLFPKIWISLLIIAIGIVPLYFLKPISLIVSQLFNIEIANNLTSIYLNLKNISLISGIFIFSTIIIFWIRNKLFKNRPVNYNGDTWGCGYTAINSKQQYTSTSFVHDYMQIAKPVLGVKRESQSMKEEEIFPSKRSFFISSDDLTNKNFVVKPFVFSIKILRKFAIFQTGKIQHYILYPFLFIILIIILTLFKVI